ncbi:MAG TPA: carboxypeptidase regulatory-like domain-containing protein [Thermoanaerobaculia bacterium]|jgi:hypothetical protein
MRKPIVFVALALFFVCLPSLFALDGLILDALSRRTVDAELRFYSLDGALQQTFYTDGSYRVYPPVGSYYIVAVPSPSRADHPVTAWPDVPCLVADAACALSGTAINLAETSMAIFYLTSPHGALRGHVVDDLTGEVLFGAIVEMSSGGSHVGDYLVFENGNFLAYPLPLGAAYTGVVEMRGYQTRSIGPYTITAAGAIDIPEVRLKRATGTIVGTIRDSNGQPLEGMPVGVRNATATAGASAVSAADGRYVIEALLPAGTYFAYAASTNEFEGAVFGGGKCPPPYGSCDLAGGALLAIGSENVTVDFTLRRYPRLTGTVTDAGTGAPLGFVNIEADAGRGFSRLSRTANDGLYTVTVRDALELRLRISEFGHVTQLYPAIDCVACNPSVAPAVALQYDGVTTADFSLHRPSRFTGRVTDGGGKPLDFTDVVVTEANGAQVATARTGSDGTFKTPAFAGVADYFVRARSTGRPDQWFGGVDCTANCDAPRGLAVRGANGADVPDVNFTLGAQPGIAAIWFTDAGGAPLAGMGVELYSSTGTLMTRTTTVSDASGLLRLNVNAGSYHVKSWNTAGYVDVLGGDIPCGSSCDVTAGTPLQIANGAASEMTLTLRRLTLTTVTPDAGLVLGGDFVTIRGGGFKPGTRVYLGATEAAVLTQTDDTLTIRTPPRASGAVDVVIVTPEGLTELRPAAFTYREPCGRLQAIGTRNGPALQLHVTSPDAYEVQWFRGSTATGTPLRTGATLFNAPSNEGTYTARITTSCDRVDVTFTFEAPEPTPGRRRAARH